MTRRPLLVCLFAALTCPAAFAAAPRAAATGAAAKKTNASELLERVNTATDTPTLTKGARGEAVLRAQVLMDQAWFSPGEIDGIFGINLQRSVRALQKARGLQVSGRIDASTWKALQGDAPAPVLAQYTLQAADTAGPFAKLPKDVMERAKLTALDFESLPEALGEKFHCSPAWLRNANPGSRFATGDSIVVPFVADETDKAPTGASALRIDKAGRVLSVLGKDDAVIAVFPISMGGRSDPLPVGRLEIKNAAKNPVFTFDPDLLKGTKKTDKKVDLPPGPNNPVGVYWLGLSQPHWGIHGTPHPARVGTAESNGCVHLTNWDVLRLAQLVKTGFGVDVHA
ncbi:L,D-transpeptidase family protein [Simplicispira psychrophila]|uniref:L,D-transpeptidase family protein n=1 Tax=Simplicispira psychrophila TaxID=80882 RepID=UPI001B807292|nr:L,D-transpeptidase family protein [Simplicispira psychrophila]